jgi:Mg-chelatase subunit ChlD
MTTVSIPQSFLCAITHDIMETPMIDPEGNSYEKTAILKWLTRNNTSPITRSSLYESQLNFNRGLKDAIDEFKVRNGMIVNDIPTVSTVSTVSTVNQDNIKRYELNDLDLVSINTKSYYDDNNVYVSINIEPREGTEAISKDIVLVVDVSGSMDSAATVNDASGEQVDVGFTLLDITKHALNTVVESMGDNDRISIVSFSNEAKVISNFTITTEANKKLLKTQINNLRTEGSTNLWDGIRVGLNQFKNINDPEFRVQSLLILTDGVPSNHYEPMQGIIATLKKYISKLSPTDIGPTIYTYGFGYSLDTPLLSEIASIGKGNFSFIPDSGFVGTVFVNSIAQMSTTIGRNANLYYEAVNGASIKKIIGYNGLNHSSIGTINYGQPKTLIIMMDVPNKDDDYLNISLQYTGVSGKYIDKPLKGDKPILKNIRENTDSISEELLRLEFVDLGYSIIYNNNLPLSENKVNEFIKNNSRFSNNSLLNDIENQVKVAVSNVNYYKKWGKNYIYSLISAHKQQRCNNFKDKSVQNYGGELFRDLRDKYNDIFDSMPPPVPSRQVHIIDNGSTSSNRTINMSRFNNVDNGCYHEDSLVHMGDGTFKKCSKIVKGDVVMTLNGMTMVLCVVKSNCYNNKCNMNVFDSGLMITPYHPIYYNNDWVFPTNVNNILKEVNCNAVYSYVLENDHSVIINNIPCITLGHNSEYSVLKHDYFGNKVISHLSQMIGYNEGLLQFEYGSIKRDQYNEVVGYDEERLIINNIS